MTTSDYQDPICETPIVPGTPDRYESDEESSSAVVHVGGRKSKLAVFQSKWVASRLRDVHPGLHFPVLALSTLGDNVQSRPLYSFGGKALWTRELETLLLHKVEGFEQIDMIVHSLKDMPTKLPEGCVLGAITEREDPRDALCLRSNTKYTGLAEMPAGTVIGTSSVRRSAQLKRCYPHLKFESVRGNVQTRLDKLDDPSLPYEAIVLAVAGLKRLGLGHRISVYLDAPEMYYAVGQGALGIEIRGGDDRVKALVERINHRPTAFCCTAERALMMALEGGCSVPIGVQSNYDSTTSMLTLTGIVVSVDGTQSAEGVASAECYNENDAFEVGKVLADDLRAKGAKEILDAIHFDELK